MNHPALRMDHKPQTEDPKALLALCFLAVFLASFLLRLHDLGSKPFWIDETGTLDRASLPLIHLIGRSFRHHHFPIFFIVTSWVLPFGRDEFWVRLPSAIFGGLSCALGFGITRSIGGLKAGLAAGMLFALSPAMVQYGQEARSYSMVISAILVGLWGVVALARMPPERPVAAAANAAGQHYAWAAYVLGTALALNVLSIAIFWFLAANLAGAILIQQHGRQFRRRWLLAQLWIIAICLPSYIGMEIKGYDGTMGAFGEVPRLDWARIWWAFSGTYLFDVISLINVRIFAPAIPGIGAMALALAACGLIAVRKQRGILAALLITVLCLPVGLLAVSVVKPIFMPRYLLWGAAPFFICTGLGFTLLPRRLQWPALAVLGLLLTFNLAPYYHDETKSRWDLAAAQIAGYRPGDLLLVDEPGAATMLTYYLKRRAVDLPAEMCTTNVARALAWRDGGNRVWAVQGIVAPTAYVSEAQFLQRIAVLGTPQFSQHAGLDILLLRFDGRPAPENLSMNIGFRAASRHLQ